MKRLLVVCLFLFGSYVFAQSCVPTGGVNCTPNLNLWEPPYGYQNWNTVINTNWSTLDAASALYPKLSTANTFTSNQTMLNLTLTGSGCGSGTYAKADGSGCGTPVGSGTVTTSGSPASGNIAVFSSSSAITAATASQINTLIKTLTGCNTSTYLYSPQSGTCVAPPTGVTSINSTPGAFTFSGSAVSCTGTTCTFTGAGSGIGSIAWSLPSWMTASPSTISASGTQTFSAATGQTSHQVIGTCGSSTSFSPCSLVVGDLPIGTSSSAVPVGGVIVAGGPTGSSTAIPVITYNAAGQLTSVTTATPTISNLQGGGVGSLPYQSAANTTTFIASPTTTGHTFVPAWQPSGSAIAPTAVDMTYAAALNYTPANCTAGTSGSDCLTLSSGLVPSGNLPTGTTSTAGAFKVDGTTISSTGGVLSVIGLGPNAGWGSQPGTGSAGAYFVQSMGGNYEGFGLAPITFSSPVTSGNTLIVIVFNEGGSSVTDSLGDTFTLSPYSANILYVYISNHIATGGTDTVTVGPPTTGTTDGTIILEYTGLPTGSGASIVTAGASVLGGSLGPTTLSSNSVVSLFTSNNCPTTTVTATGATSRFNGGSTGHCVNELDMVVDAGSFAINVNNWLDATGFIAIGLP